jgi:hypothetical protein
MKPNRVAGRALARARRPSRHITLTALRPSSIDAIAVLSEPGPHLAAAGLRR